MGDPGGAQDGRAAARHLSYQRQVDLGSGPIEVTGLDCDGADRGNWAIVDVTSMRWLHFAGRPIRNALRGLVSR